MSRGGMRRGGLRLAITPIVLLVVTAAILRWVNHAQLDSSESAVLSIDNLRARGWEHVQMSVVSTALATLVAVPLGIVMSRRPLRRARTPILFAVNIGQTVPTVAVLALMLTVTGLGFRTAVFALWIYSLLPILQNTLVGLRGVDPPTVEAARGMGMGPVSTLLRIELPLAMPVMIAGIRTAAVVNVGTAALGTFIGAGGLGAIIEIGINNQRDHLLYVGAMLTAVLALAADWVVGLVGALISPRHTQATG
jgi:osmoprotectant transport system permease protein